MQTTARIAENTAKLVGTILDAAAQRQFAAARAASRQLLARLIRQDRQDEFPELLEEFTGNDRERARIAARDLRKVADKVCDLYSIGDNGDMFCVLGVGHCGSDGDHGLIADDLRQLFYALERTEPCQCQYCDWQHDGCDGDE